MLVLAVSMDVDRAFDVAKTGESFFAKVKWNQSRNKIVEDGKVGLVSYKERKNGLTFWCGASMNRRGDFHLQ